MPYTTVPLSSAVDLYTEVCGPIFTELVPKWHYSEANGYRATTRIAQVKIDSLARLSKTPDAAKAEPLLVAFAKLDDPEETDKEPAKQLFPDKVEKFVYAGHTISGSDLFWKVMGLNLATSANRAFVCALSLVEMIDFLFVESPSSGERWAIKDMGLVQGSVHPNTFMPMAVVLDWSESDVAALDGNETLSPDCNVLVQTGRKHEWIYVTLENDVVYWADFTACQFDRFQYRKATKGPYILGQPNSEKFAGYQANGRYSISRNGIDRVYPAQSWDLVATVTNVPDEEPSGQSSSGSDLRYEPLGAMIDAPIVENLTMVFCSLLVQAVNARFTHQGEKLFKAFLVFKGAMPQQSSKP